MGRGLDRRDEGLHALLLERPLASQGRTSSHATSPRGARTIAYSVTRARACPHAARAESGDASAAAPARAEAALADRGDRAPGRDASAVAAGAVRRHLDAHDWLSARRSRALA